MFSWGFEKTVKGEDIFWFQVLPEEEFVPATLHLSPFTNQSVPTPSMHTLVHPL